MEYMKTYDTLIAPGVKLQDQICQLCPASNTSMVTPFERLPTGCCVFSIVHTACGSCSEMLFFSPFSCFLTLSHFCLTFSHFSAWELLFLALFLIFSHVISCDSYYVLPSRVRFALFCICLHFFACCWHVCSRVVTWLPFLHVLWGVTMDACPLKAKRDWNVCIVNLSCLVVVFSCNVNPKRKSGKKNKKWENMRKHQKMWEKVGIGETKVR